MKNITLQKKFLVSLFTIVMMHFLSVNVYAQYTINTSVSPSAGGVITGADGTFTSGQTVTLTATPEAGYEFSRWRDGSGYHTENPYTFTITGNVNIRAYFEVAQTRYNVNVIFGTPGSESVCTVVGAGQKVEGESFTLTANYPDIYIVHVTGLLMEWKFVLPMNSTTPILTGI